MTLNFLVKLRRVLIALIKWLAVLCAFVALCIYGFEARERWIEVPRCNWVPIPNTENTPYSARLCYLTRDTTLLRVYDAGGEHLLVERSYFDIGRVSVYWFPNKIIYDTTGDEIFDDGTVFLPPSMLDWLRAKLP